MRVQDTIRPVSKTVFRIYCMLSGTGETTQQIETHVAVKKQTCLEKGMTSSNKQKTMRRACSAINSARGYQYTLKPISTLSVPLIYMDYLYGFIIIVIPYWLLIAY